MHLTVYWDWAFFICWWASLVFSSGKCLFMSFVIFPLSLSYSYPFIKVHYISWILIICRINVLQKVLLFSLFSILCLLIVILNFSAVRLNQIFLFMVCCVLVNALSYRHKIFLYIINLSTQTHPHSHLISTPEIDVCTTQFPLFFPKWIAKCSSSTYWVACLSPLFCSALS